MFSGLQQSDAISRASLKQLSIWAAFFAVREAWVSNRSAREQDSLRLRADLHLQRADAALRDGHVSVLVRSALTAWMLEAGRMRQERAEGERLRLVHRWLQQAGAVARSSSQLVLVLDKRKQRRPSSPLGIHMFS